MRQISIKMDGKPYANVPLDGKEAIWNMVLPTNVKRMIFAWLKDEKVDNKYANYCWGWQ